MAIAIIAAIGVAVAAGTAGYQMSGAGQPNQPNLAASSAEMANVEANLLPAIRQMQAAAEEGKTALLPGYKTETVSQEQKDKIQKEIDGVQRQLNAAQSQSQVAGRGQNQAARIKGLQTKLAGLKTQYDAIPEGGGLVYLDKHGKVVPKGQALADFTGNSEADIQGKIMQQEAANQLALSQKYDSQFIQSALDQEKLADPQSFEARQKMFDLVEQQHKNPPDSPVADEMERQIKGQVAAGSGLTDEEKQLLAAAIASGSADRGGTTGADFANPLTTGTAGEQRALRNAAAGGAYLASGETPEDIAYRADQQDLANLAAIVNGQTPQSQFRELSGAQAGPTPNSTGTAPALATMSPQASQLGASAAVQGYGYGVQNALQQANPWMAGISGALGLANVAGASGYKPLALQSQTATV